MEIIVIDFNYSVQFVGGCDIESCMIRVISVSKECTYRNCPVFLMVLASRGNLEFYTFTSILNYNHMHITKPLVYK